MKFEFLFVFYFFIFMRSSSPFTSWAQNFCHWCIYSAVLSVWSIKRGREHSLNICCSLKSTFWAHIHSIIAAYSQDVRSIIEIAILQPVIMFAAYWQNVRRIFTAYSICSFESMFAAYLQNDSRTFAAYLNCSLELCSLNFRRIFAGCSHGVFATNLICI